MLDKIKAGWNVLQKGQCVADPQMWKTHQMTANAVAAFIMALVYAGKVFFDVTVPIDEDAAVSIGGGTLAVINIVLTMATSTKVGLSPKRVPDPDPQPRNDEFTKPGELRNDRVDYGG